MTVREATCATCGHTWTTNQEPQIEWCSSECADTWMDAHPIEKARRGWPTRRDLVDRLLDRYGLIPPPRCEPGLGNN